VIASDGDTIGPEHVPLEIREEGASRQTVAASIGRSFLEQKAEPSARSSSRRSTVMIGT